MDQQDQHDDSTEWGTRAEIARLGRVSDKTVERRSKAAGLETAAGTNGVVKLRYADCVRIGLITAADIPSGLTGSQAAEVRRLEQQVARLLTEKGELTGRLAELGAARDLASEQLRAKDDLLKTQAATIAKLVAAVERRAA